MRAEAQKKPDDQLEIHFKPEPEATYEDVAQVMATAQREGLQKIGIANTEVFAPKF